MKKHLLLFIVILIVAKFSLGQTKPENDHASRKYYFPVSLFNDSVALRNAIPSLAKKVIADFSDNEKKDYAKSAGYNFLAQDYQRVLAYVDSLERKEDVLSGMEFKAYAMARLNEKDKPGSFDHTFKQNYTDDYNKLTFRKKVAVALLDTNAMNDIKKGNAELMEKLKKNKSDSLSYEDAESLLDNLSAYYLYKQIYPLISSLITDKRYVQMFPAMKGYKGAGVVPVENPEEKLDPNMQYKLLMELSGFAQKGDEANAKKEINVGIGEVARKINLHVAGGVPKEKLDVAIVLHGPVLFALLNNEKYKRKYDVDNPNVALIKELQNFGVRFIVCGQAMTFLRLEKEDLLPGIKEALSAQTVISTYESKGYVLYNIKLD